MKDPLSGAYIQGHQYVQALLVFRGYVIPFGIRLYVPKDKCEDAGVAFRKTTQLAAQLVRAFTAPNGVKVTVLFDSYYLCKPVVSACRAKGFHFVPACCRQVYLEKQSQPLQERAQVKSWQVWQELLSASA